MRILVTLAVFVLVLGALVACTRTEDDDAEPAEDTATEEPASAADETPEPDPTETPEPEPTETPEPEPTEPASPEPEETETAEPDETPTPDAGDEPDDAEEHVVEIQDNVFEPETLEITAGDTVTWVNEGQIVHTTTLDPEIVRDPENAVLPDGAETWDSGDMEPGDEFSVTLDVPGEYVYFCRPHEALGMVGTIIVEEP